MASRFPEINFISSFRPVQVVIRLSCKHVFHERLESFDVCLCIEILNSVVQLPYPVAGSSQYLPNMSNRASQ